MKLCSLVTLLLLGSAMFSKVSFAQEASDVVIRKIIAQEKLCGWGQTCGEKIFDVRASHLTHLYLTHDFSAVWTRAIRHNKELPVWDGDIFTGAQQITLVGPDTLKTVHQTADSSDVDVGLETIDEGGKRHVSHSLFKMKFEAGRWKLDDIILLHRQQPGKVTVYKDESEKDYFHKMDK